MVSCAALGAIVGGAAVSWLAPGAGSGDSFSPPGPAAATAAPSTGAQPGAVVDLAPVLLRLDEVARRLGRLEEAVAALPASPARTPVGDAVASVQVDPAALADALETVERRKLEALSDQELLGEARRLQKTGDTSAARQRLEELLRRPLDPETRARAGIELGMLRRSEGGADGRAAAAALFRSVIDAHGLASELGSQAALQLVWTDVKGPNDGSGLTMADTLIATPGVPTEVRTNARWAAAILAQGRGDTARARADFTALLREIDGQPGQEKLAADVRRRLEGL